MKQMVILQAIKKHEGNEVTAEALTSKKGRGNKVNLKEAGN